MRRRFLVGPVLYGVATVVGLVNGAVSLGLYGLLIVFFMIENRPRPVRGAEPAVAEVG